MTFGIILLAQKNNTSTIIVRADRTISDYTIRGASVMNYGFITGFAKDLEDLITLKVSFGFSEATHLDRT